MFASAACALAACAMPAVVSAGEAPFAFRARYDRVHEPGLRDCSLVQQTNEFAFVDGCSVGDADFADYLRTSMGVACAPDGPPAVRASVGGVEKGYEVEVDTSGVRISAADRRMLHQAYYHLEDLMNLRRAPYLTFGREQRTPIFSPRMIHSGWGFDEFSDGYLLNAAHHGFDAILVYVWDAAEPRASEVRDLVRRASARGLDTYLYSRVNTRAFVHPDDPSAEAVLDATYGSLAAAFPEARGILFVGESFEFPSRDERTCGLAIDYARDRRAPGDVRPYPGWFPCRDYPKLVDAVRRSLHKVNPRLEVILWSYNWGYCDEGPRRELVAALPKGIPLLVTYEMFEKYAIGDGLPVKVADYSIAFEGPGRYFVSEAEEAHARGAVLYAMANTAGRTWDLGLVPYMPVPYQWKRRWDGLRKARDKWGLSGLVESHHFGWAPSFVSELAKEAFTDGGMDFEDHLRLIAARDFGTSNAEAACAAWRQWSEAIRDTKPSSVNQGGPFRYGPAYPFNALRPDVTWADMSMSPMFVNPNYRSRASHEDNSDELLRLETRLLDSVAERFMSGADAFRRMEGEKARAMARLGEYMARSYITAANVKRGLMVERRNDEAAVVELARREYDNVRAALALVEADSSLGYEPRLGYRGDARAIRMKMKWMERHYFGGAVTEAEPYPEMDVALAGRTLVVKNRTDRDFESGGLNVVQRGVGGKEIGKVRLTSPFIRHGEEGRIPLPFDPSQVQGLRQLDLSFEQFEYGTVLQRIVKVDAPVVDPEFDLVIYGSTPAAISAAVQARRMGKKAVVVSPKKRIGGLTTGGLGQTDIGNKSAFGGIALEFYRDIAKWYGDPAHWTWQRQNEYFPDGQCAGTKGRDSMWTFEPSVALAVLEGWEKRDGLDIRRGELLDREHGVDCTNGRIVSLRTLSGNTYRGRMFIDATYEGDLMAAAGVSYVIGREPNAKYGETLNGFQPKLAVNHQFRGRVDPYVVQGDPGSGLLPGVEPFDPKEQLGDGDCRVQAYCFRMCLTDEPGNRIPFARPENYDERNYELLFRYFEQLSEKELANDYLAMNRINSKMPNRKTDTNNCGPFSSDFIGGNWEWPESSYERREQILKAHLDYQRGFVWTMANHPRVPERVRREYSKWGTCRDEFHDGLGDGWQNELYVREARRMVGDYVMTEANCRGARVASRPVGLGAYGMDSHHVRRRVGEDGFVRNEGDVEIHRDSNGVRYPPYPVDYGSLVPKRGECGNLLVPVCVSATHIAFGSLRMEPVFFALGQSAGTAAALAIDAGCTVQDLDYAALRARLLSDGQVLDFKKK